jgi:hypothetical protein
MVDHVLDERNDADEHEPAERDHATMYFVGDCPFLPHYVDDGVFVAPGGRRIAENVLLQMGAVARTAFLWPRQWQKAKKAAPRRPNRFAFDDVVKLMSVNGGPWSVADMAAEIGASTSAIRDAVRKLHDTGIIKAWGSRTNNSSPQLWMLKGE